MRNHAYNRNFPLFLKECRRIATSLVYFLFVGVLVIGWIQNFQGGTKAEIDWANGKPPAGMTFERPLLLEPSEEDDYFGSKTSEEYPEKIMVGVTRKLLMEYENNIYETYPLGNYKAVTLGSKEQSRVLEILCEITGLTKEQLENLPQDYFPAVNFLLIGWKQMKMETLLCKVEMTISQVKIAMKQIGQKSLYHRSVMNISTN